MLVEKKILTETQIEMAGAAVLKRILWMDPLRGLIQNVITRHSNATVRAPASARNQDGRKSKRFGNGNVGADGRNLHGEGTGQQSQKGKDEPLLVDRSGVQ